MLAAEGAGGVIGIEEAAVDQQAGQALADVRLIEERLLDVGRRGPALLDEELAERPAPRGLTMGRHEIEFGRAPRKLRREAGESRRASARQGGAGYDAAMQGSVRCAMVSLGAAALIALAGCGGKAAPPKRPVSQGQEKARQEARAVVDEVYRALRSGDTDDLLSMMSDDVVVLGPRPGDLLRSRAEVVTALRAQLEARKRPRFTSQGLRLALGPGSGSAYAVDRVQLAGRPVVALALLEGERAIWRVRAVHLQAPLGGGALKRALAAGTLAAPASAAEPPLAEGEAPARELAQQLGKVGSWVAALEADDEAVVIGADGAVAAGAKAIGRAAKRLGEVRFAATSPVAAVVSGDGQLALATCTATRTIAAADDDRKPEPDGKGGPKKGGSGKGGPKKGGKGAAPAAEAPRAVRVTAILRREGSHWRLAAFAEAHALAEPAAPAKK